MRMQPGPNLPSVGEQPTLSKSLGFKPHSLPDGCARDPYLGCDVIRQRIHFAIDQVWFALVAPWRPRSPPLRPPPVGHVAQECQPVFTVAGRSMPTPLPKGPIPAEPYVQVDAFLRYGEEQGLQVGVLQHEMRCLAELLFAYRRNHGTHGRTSFTRLERNVELLFKIPRAAAGPATASRSS